MAVDVKVPAVGESIQEAMIHKWHKKSGDSVRRDEVLLELETDKATVEITAESDGVLQILRPNGTVVAIGEVIGKLESDAGAGAVKPSVAPASPPPPPSGVHAVDKKEAAKGETKGMGISQTAEGKDLSPAVRRLVSEEKIDPSAISGTGKGGRLTKGDVLSALETKNAPPSVSAPVVSVSGSAPARAVPQVPGARTERREPMSMLRRRIAERLVHAQSTAAILTTFNEVDMKAVMDLRKQYKDPFKEKHGVNLGFMSFFVKAAVEALKKFPAINGWIDQNEIVYHDYYDIGVAVSSERGLVVPVIRDVDRLSMPEIEKEIVRYSTKARDQKITVEDLNGGTFTISNGGVFGSLLSTPILNPPQSAILGMHKIQERPVVVGGQVVVRPMMYLALSYDHRIVDGKEAVQFLVTIKDMVEDPTRLLLGV
jgi:2-oxoglutarate dehydrogenase E2 component (dihydrolipoamide succinyltransferase)